MQYFSTNFAKSLEKSFIIYYNVGVFLRKINIIIVILNVCQNITVNFILEKIALLGKEEKDIILVIGQMQGEKPENEISILANYVVEKRILIYNFLFIILLITENLTISMKQIS